MELPQRKRNRLEEFDYSTPSAYFITVCTANRKNLFWQDVGAIIDRPENVQLSRWGRIVDGVIREIPAHYPMISIERYVIMPNHIHLLLQIHPCEGGRSVIAPTISTVIRHLKGFVSRQAGFSVWQKGFYDHVVRSENDFLDIWQYIEGNPSKWAEDELYCL